MNRRTLACCAVFIGLLSAAAGTAAPPAEADDWPQWRGPRRDGVWRESGIIKQLPAGKLPHVWRAEIGAGYSGPTVAEGRVFVTDRLTVPKQVERVLAFDSATGRPLWQHAYDCDYAIGYPAGPRANVTVDDGRAFALGAMGRLVALAAATGDVLWQHDLAEEYRVQMPIWGLAAAPLVDGERLIVHCGGRPGASLVAFNKRTGEELWRSLDDRASYCAPILIQQAGVPVLVALTGDHVVGLDPATGKPYWQHPFPPTKMVISISTPVVEDHRLFVTSFYDGCLLLQLAADRPAVTQLWRRQGRDERHTDGLHSIISTPLFEGGYIYGFDSYGELRCLKASTGERVWESAQATTQARWGTAHIVRHDDEAWLFNERGDLIIAQLTPAGYHELSRSHLIDPTREQLNQRGGVCWSHPAFANRHIFARSDLELVCASLAAE